MSSSWYHIHYITSVILYIYSRYATAFEYYVSAAPNGVSCNRTNLPGPCHNLSYYIADYESYFTDDTIFYFLEGTHTLQDTLEISNVSNITLQGLGHIEQGFHETVMQSTSVIDCSDYNSTGIQFTNSTDVVLKSLTIANCEFYTFFSDQAYPYKANFSLFFVDIDNVTLEWVSVQNGSVYGLCLVNSFNVLIVNSSFANHRGAKTSGGNALIVYDDEREGLFRVIIMKSNFTLSLSGNGLDFWYFTKNKAEVIIENCHFSHNTVLYGGGIQIISRGNGTLELRNCTIYNNTAHYGGGLFMRSYGNSSIEFVNCTFYNNISPLYGGGMFLVSKGGGNTEFHNCAIYNNTAYIASGVVVYDFRVASESTGSFHFTNVLVHSNKITNNLDVYRNAMLLINIHNVFFDQMEISNHNTTGLMGVNSKLTFDKNSTFANNSGIYGGGLGLHESSQLFLKENASISFVNNHASKSGGGIFVARVLEVDIATDCPFRVIPRHYSYDNKTTLYFVNNTAGISGDVLYGGKNKDCLYRLFFDNLFNYPEQTGLSVVSSDPVKVCFCESDKQNCSISSSNITLMRGIEVNVSLATVGIKDGLTEGVIKLRSSDGSPNIQTDNNRLNASCTNVTFTLNANSSLNTTQVHATLETSIRDKIIYVTIKPCPIGFPLVNDACVCRSELTTSSITCDINTEIITRHSDVWVGYKNDSDCLIVYPNCPFDYCNDKTIQFKVTSPDPQCLLKRSGLLCGQCTKGLSLMLGSNQCGQCTNAYIALIIPFALAGIALVAFVVVLNLTVSVGTINGLIFYANVVKIYEPIFFPDGPIPFLSQFISWLNLDLGIQTCFYDGMDSCGKAWLQFIFPGYVWFILIFIIILSRYSSKVVRLVGRQAIPVLATMILLSYTKLIRIVFQVLRYANIPCSGENNVTLQRWYIDANVQYLRGCHIPLFLFSLAVLILLIVPYTFFLLTIPLSEGPLSKYICCSQKLSIYMKPFFDAYGGPYKDKCRFWTGFLLLVRVVLALVVSIDTDATIRLDVLTSLLIIIMFMYLLLKGIYRQFALLCLEEYFILKLVIMAHINLQTSEKSKRQVSSIVLVSISFIVFCGIILYHVWDRLLKSHSQKPFAKVKEISKKLPLPSSNDDIELPSTVNTSTHPVSPNFESNPTSTTMLSVEMRRESLLFDD